MRRLLFAILSLFMLLPMTAASILAQDATPGPSAAFAGLDLPTLDVTVTASAFEGVPDTLEAGRYLVSVTASEDTGEFGGGLAFVQPPSGMTADEFLAMMMGPPDESGVGAVAATPVEGAEASPAATGGMPEAVFTAHYAGGAYAEAGQTAQVVLDLGPGEWIAWADDPEAPQTPVVFEVTGEMPADLAEPESGATITMGEYVIQVTAGALTAGPQVVRVDNIGAQPHFIGWYLGPDDMTAEQIQVVLDEEMQAEMSGTPVAYSDLNPEEDLTPVAFTATQSMGTSQWIAVDVPAGMIGLVCFFPDIAEGIPHAFLGMFTVVEVPE
jgi:hypothetical protein